jgi:hypothetical protein
MTKKGLFSGQIKIKNDYLLHSAKAEALVGGAFFKKLPQTPAKTLMAAY